MRNEEPSMYGAIATLRNGEATLRWTSMQIFLLFNSVAIPLLTRPEFDSRAKIALSAVGAALSIIWFLVTIRAQQWMMFWNESMRRLEVLDVNHTDPPASQPRVLVFSSRWFAEISREWITFHLILHGMTVVAMFVWFFLLANYIAG